MAGEFHILTICQDFICMLRPRFDKAPECLVSVIMSEFVARHKELSKNCHHACVCVYACMFDLCVCKLPGTTFTFCSLEVS